MMSRTPTPRASATFPTPCRIALLRSDLPGVATALARRGFIVDVAAFAALEEQRKGVQIEADRLRAERNSSAKAVGMAKAKGQDVAALLAAGEALGSQVQAAEAQLESIQSKLAAWTRRERKRRSAPRRHAAAL
jgi:seryl-tRNA synthetase